MNIQPFNSGSLTNLLPEENSRHSEKYAPVTPFTPKKIMDNQCPDQPVNMPDTQPLESRTCTEPNPSILLSSSDLKSIKSKYGEAGKENAIKLSETINNSNNATRNISLIWDEEKSVFRVPGSESMTKYTMSKVIQSEYNNWFPHLSKKPGEDFEITLKCFQQLVLESPPSNYLQGPHSDSKEPYPLVEESSVALLDNTPSSKKYVASYANANLELIENATQIGNQKLISFNSDFDTSDVTISEMKNYIEINKLEYITDFLKQNKSIKYIVDVGCGNAEKSLLLQKLLVDKQLDVTVFPIDVSRVKDSKLPFNLIPAQEIENADSLSTAFVVIHPFTESHHYPYSCHNEMFSSFYITQLIRNNPGCFVLTTESGRQSLSTPNHYIPHELVHTKRFFTNFSVNDQKVFNEQREIKKFLKELPENKSDYLVRTQQLKEQFLKGGVDVYDENAGYLFNLYAHEKLKPKGVNYLEFVEKIEREDGKSLKTSWWHVYQQAV